MEESVVNKSSEEILDDIFSLIKTQEIKYEECLAAISDDGEDSSAKKKKKKKKKDKLSMRDKKTRKSDDSDDDCVIIMDERESKEKKAKKKKKKEKKKKNKEKEEYEEITKDTFHLKENEDDIHDDLVGNPSDEEQLSRKEPSSDVDLNSSINLDDQKGKDGAVNVENKPMKETFSYNANLNLPKDLAIQEKSDQLLKDLFTYIDDEKNVLKVNKKKHIRKSRSRSRSKRIVSRGRSKSRSISRSKKNISRTRSRENKKRNSRRSRSRSKGRRRRSTSRKYRSRGRSRSRSKHRTRSDSRDHYRRHSRSESRESCSSPRRSRSRELIEAADKFERDKKSRLAMKQHLIEKGKLRKLARKTVQLSNQAHAESINRLTQMCFVIAKQGLSDQSEVKETSEDPTKSTEDSNNSVEVVIYVFATPSIASKTLSNDNYKRVLNTELDKYSTDVGKVTKFWMSDEGYDRAWEKVSGNKKYKAFTVGGPLNLSNADFEDYQKVYLPTTIKVQTPHPDKWKNNVSFRKTIFARASLFGDCSIHDNEASGRKLPPSAFPTNSGRRPVTSRPSKSATVSTALVDQSETQSGSGWTTRRSEIDGSMEHVLVKR